MTGRSQGLPCGRAPRARVIGAAVSLLLMACPIGVAAGQQTASPEGGASRNTIEESDSIRAPAPRSAAMRTRLYVGMWSTHLRDIKRGLLDNSLIGIAYHGYYAATFINSFGDRAVTAGIQRSFTPGRDGWVTTSLGYRAGVLTGYDERFFGIGDKSPLIPFVQLVGTLDCRNLGVELGYAGVVATVTLSLRL